MENELKEWARELKSLLITVVVASLAAFFTGLVNKKTGLIIAIFSLLGIVCFLFFQLKKYRPQIDLIKTGARGHFKKVTVGMQDKIYRQAKHSFFYLGTSARTIIDYVSAWDNEHPPVQNYTFALMNPGSPNLIKIKAHEMGFDFNTDLDSLDAQTSEALEIAVEEERSKIRSSIATLKTLQPYREGKLKIFLYDQLIPYWMYIMDESAMYVGILEKSGRNPQGPATYLEKVHEELSLFNTFTDIRDAIISKAEKVEGETNIKKKILEG